jgi:hypothetical protein
MQATTCFHDGIANPIFQQTDFVFHDPVAFHPTNGVFNTHSGGGNSTIGLLLRRGQFPARWGFLGLDDRDARQAKPLQPLMDVGKDSGQKLMDFCMTGESAISWCVSLTKLEVSKRPKRTDLSLDLQGVTPVRDRGV